AARLGRDTRSGRLTGVRRTGDASRADTLFEGRSDCSPPVLDHHQVGQAHEEQQAQPCGEDELDRREAGVAQPPSNCPLIHPTMSTPRACKAPQMTTSAAIARAALPISSAVFSPLSS